MATAELESGDFWIYIVGPLVGAAFGVLAYELVRGSPDVH
jgi:glycerol uptake facilitator-like aquaporin